MKKISVSNLGNTILPFLKSLNNEGIILTNGNKKPIAVLLGIEEYKSIETILKMDLKDLIELYKAHQEIENGNLTDYVDVTDEITK
ncbi:hypothetical protein [uncultured Desulfosarcina sp.]|uniref:hypothetical protein n=1 Tax=uncultured Desulfosarcina sp. TaxID=218289 RepID=UPI0029C61873|nr:hypothetical protein [uncultured Desulfosarcina sp.]